MLFRSKVTRTEIVGRFTRKLKDPISGRETDEFRTPRGGVENDPELLPLFDKHNVEYTADEEPSAFKLALIWLLPLLLVMGFLYFVLFRKLGAGGAAMTFGPSKAKLYAQEDLNISFEDVAGLDEATEELRDVVDFLKTPQK